MPHVINRINPWMSFRVYQIKFIYVHVKEKIFLKLQLLTEKNSVCFWAWSATVLVWYGPSVHTKQYTKNPNAKHAVKAEISMKTISFNDSICKTFSIFRQLIDEWRQIVFVYDVIGNMAIAKLSVDARGDSIHRTRQVLRRVYLIAMCRRNWFHYDLQVCSEVQDLSTTASRLWFYAYKKYENGNSARRTSTRCHIRLPIYLGGRDNFSSGISWKLQKIANLNVIFSRTANRIAAKFVWQFRRSSPMTYFKTLFNLLAL